MLLKVFLVFGIVPRAFLLTAEDEGIETKNDKAARLKIRHEVLAKMSDYTQGLWNITSPDENIQIFPFMDVLNKNIDLHEVYYENYSARLQPHAKFLEEPLELVKLLNKMQNTSLVNLKLKTAIFADGTHVSAAYLQDVRVYYHGKTDSAKYDANDSVSIQYRARKWITDNTRGRTFTLEDPLLPKPVHLIHTNVLQYKACWYYPMMKDYMPLEFFLYLPPKAPEYHCKFWPRNVVALSQTQVLKYFNNTVREYEAISIPYRGNEFGLAVVMPYKSKPLDTIVNFTDDDYFYLLGHIRRASNRPEEVIHYVIPELNIPMVSITENGTSINQNNPVYCGPALHWNGDPRFIKQPPVLKFIVNRPYGLILYHESTMFVLWQAWIRDPLSNDYVFRRFNFTNNPSDEKLGTWQMF